MPDPVVQTEPTAPGAPPPAAPPLAQPAPAAPPQPTQQAPPTKPPAQPAPSGQGDDLSPNTVIEYTGKDGSKRYATIRDLVDRAESEGAQISAEQLARLRTIERGLAGNDPESVRAMLEMVAPGVVSGQPQTPSEPEDPRDARIAKLEAAMKPALELTEQVQEQQMTAGCSALVEKWAEKVPYLAKHPEAGAIVYNRVRALNDTYRAAGQDPERLPREQQLKIVADAMRGAENELRAIASIYGGVATPPQPNPATNVQVTNDQNAPGVEPGVIPARFRVDPQTGQLVDNRGAPVSQTPYGATVPGDVPNPTAVGGHVAGTVPASKQPMTPAQLLNIMHARVAEMNTQ